jgi:hypothetical protein
MDSRWRRISVKVIAPLEAKYRNQTYAEFKRALSDAYPFGVRSNYPYKIWCQEQRYALRRHPQSPEYAGTQDDLLARLEESSNG